MNDAEVINALACCVFTQPCAFDEDKFYCHHGYSKFCDKALLDDVFDLINRKEAEIERLLTENHSLAIVQEGFKDMYKIVKAEAYKDFAEEVNKELFGEEYQLDKARRRAVERVLNRLTNRE